MIRNLVMQLFHRLIPAVVLACLFALLVPVAIAGAEGTAIQVRAFGDSVTVGCNASDYAHPYVSLVSAHFGWSTTNYATGGANIADYAIGSNSIYARSIAAGDVAFTLTGYVDMNMWGTDSVKQAYYKNGLYALVAWLALPASQKQTRSSISFVGTGWANTTEYGLGENTSNAGDYATTTVTGSTIYISVQARYGTGDIGVTVDGTSAGTFTPGSSPPPYHVAYYPSLIRITGLSDTSHTVVVRCASGCLYLDWIAGLAPVLIYPYSMVWVGNCLHMPPGHYGNGSDAAVTQFNVIILQVVQDLCADGLKIYYADADSLYNLATDVSSDYVHPNDSGHAHIATAFEQAVTWWAPTDLTITSVSPGRGYQGQTLSATITGTNFTNVTAVSFGSGIAVNSFEVNSATEITASITISDSATPGTRDVSATNSADATTLPNGFTVDQYLPCITGVNPSVGIQGQALNVLIVGNCLLEATAVDFGLGITTNSFTVESAGKIMAFIEVASSTALGPRTVSVTTPLGMATLPSGFEVIIANWPPNQPSNVSPANGATGVSLTPTLCSTAFSDPDIGDAHAASQWQVRLSTIDYSTAVYDSSGSVSALTEVNIPSAPGQGSRLNYSTTYYWRVRHQDNHGAWSDWSMETSFRTQGAPNASPSQPTNISPAAGAVSIGLMPTLESSAFSDPDTGDMHYASEWQITGMPGDYSSPIFDSGIDISYLTSVSVATDTLNYSTTYYWHVRHQDNHGAWSDWSTETSFTTAAAAPPNQAPNQPGNVLPSSGVTGISLTPTLQSSAFSDPDSGDTHAASQWQISTTADNYSGPVFDSSTDASHLTSINVPSLNYSTTYYWHVRYRDNHGDWSSWSSETSFSTLASTSVTADVTTEGGTVGVEDGRIVAQLPAGAVATTATVTIKQVEPSSAAAPKGFKAGSTYFIIEAKDAGGNAIVTLLQPMTITVRYSDEDVAADGGDPTKLALAYYYEAAAEWKTLDTTVNTTDKTLSTTTTHFSTWAILAKSPSEGIASWIWIVIGIGAALGAGILAYSVRRMLSPKV